MSLTQHGFGLFYLGCFHGTQSISLVGKETCKMFLELPVPPRSKVLLFQSFCLRQIITIDIKSEYGTAFGQEVTP